MITLDWAALAAVLSAYSAVLVTIVGYKTRQALKTGANSRSIGEQIDNLRAEFAEVADAKLMADARLASAALVAVARLAREAKEDANLLAEAQRTAEEVIAKADKTAQRLADEGVLPPPNGGNGGKGDKP